MRPSCRRRRQPARRGSTKTLARDASSTAPSASRSRGSSSPGAAAAARSSSRRSAHLCSPRPPATTVLRRAAPRSAAGKTLPASISLAVTSSRGSPPAGTTVRRSLPCSISRAASTTAIAGLGGQGAAVERLDAACGGARDERRARPAGRRGPAWSRRRPCRDRHGVVLTLLDILTVMLHRATARLDARSGARLRPYIWGAAQTPSGWTAAPRASAVASPSWATARARSAAVVTYDVEAGEIRVERGGGVEVRTESIFDYLGRELERLRPLSAELPFDFDCGFAGYLGYELKAECDGAAAHAASTPDAAFVLADRMIAFDHQERHTYPAQPDREPIPGSRRPSGGSRRCRRWPRRGSMRRP